MDRIQEMLDRVSELSADELSELQETIVSEFKAVSEQDLTREVVDQMKALQAAHESASAEVSRREAEAAEFASVKDSAASQILGETTEPEQEAAVGDSKSEEDLEDDEEIDPATGKKRKKAVEPEVVAEASVNTPDESEAVSEDAPVESAAEFGIVEAEVNEGEQKVTSDPEPVVEAQESKVENPEEPSVVESEEVAKESEEKAAESEVDEVEEPKADEPEDEVKSEEVVSEDAASEEEEGTPVTAAANESDLVVEVSDDRTPAPKVAAPVIITAGADIPGVTAGTELTSMRQVAQAILDRKKGMGRTSGGDGEQHTVATFSTSFPAERTLSSSDEIGNRVKIDAEVTAVVAAGGLCAPVETSYDIFGFGIADRPVRDSLPVFGADRGGIRFVTSPTLVDLNGSVSLWTLQDDIDAATEGAPDPVKPCLRVACGQEVTVYTDAIPLCLTFGNLNARAYPELVERHTELGMIWHARYAETRLITRIGALSTAVTAGHQLGAARDFFVQVDQAAAAYRNRHRLDENETLRVILPLWFKNALRADLTKQQPGDGLEATFNLTDAQIDSFFRARDIAVTWMYDGETGQILGAQAAGALNPFPANVVWYLFSEGTFLFLDGGTLDLGLVRDSTLNGTNDYKIFLETFEGVAKVGIESLRVTSTLRIAGAHAAGEDTIAA